MVTAGSGRNNWMEFRRILRIQFRRQVYTPLLRKHRIIIIVKERNLHTGILVIALKTIGDTT